MKKLHVPASEGELLMIKSLFQREGVRHYVQNDAVGTLYGAFSGGALRKAVFVAEADEARARDLLMSVQAKSAAAAPNVISDGGADRRRRKGKVGRALLLVLMLFFLVPFVLFVIRAARSYLEF